VRQEEMLANCVSGSRMVVGLVFTSREMGNPRISDPKILNTSLTSLHRGEDNKSFLRRRK
jgi:hypothetical protein